MFIRSRHQRNFLSFHPRRHIWTEHFHLEGVTIIGLTPIGRTTIALLPLNCPGWICERQRLAHWGYTSIGRMIEWLLSHL
jgi:hypothetical protein